MPGGVLAIREQAGQFESGSAIAALGIQNERKPFAISFGLGDKNIRIGS